jgi:hypothetical protein
MKSWYATLFVTAVLAGLLTAGSPGAQSLFTKTPTVQPVQADQTSVQVLKFARTASPDFLAGRPDASLVELQDGRRLKVGDIRRLTALTRKARAAAPGSRMPQALKLKPAAKGTPLHTAADIAAALERPDGETVQLPSGKTMTVGLLKLVREDVERRLGRSLTAGTGRPDLSGTAVRVAAGTDWKNILGRPDGTVLESPRGKRITVGELKQALAASGTMPAPPVRKP